MDIINIKITGSRYAQVTMKDPASQNMISKIMSIDGLVACLSRKEIGAESDFMPPNMFKKYISDMHEIYWMHFDQCAMPIHFNRCENPDEQDQEVYIPPMIMQFTFRKNNGRNILVNTKLFTMNPFEVFGPKSKCYPFPLNNYRASYSPGVCWGSYESHIKNMFTEEIDPFKLTSLHRAYFAGEFNSDLGGDGINDRGLDDAIDNIKDVETNQSLRNRRDGIYEYLRKCNLSKTHGFDPERIFTGPAFDTVEAMIASGISTASSH